MILYLFISLLEDSGYMARAAFIMDKIMHRIGLHGKSFIPMIMGFGCNVPAVMATRTIESRRSRLITMLIIPFMSCTGRLPLYILFAGIFFPGCASLVLLGIYVLGIAAAVASAHVIGLFVKEEDLPFVMELPPYRIPTAKSVLLHTWEKGKQYLRKMSGIILVCSVVVWFLGYFPATTSMPPRPNNRKTPTSPPWGKTLEPAFRPLGFDWKMSTGILSGIGAKELVVSTLGVMYSSETDAEDASGGTPGCRKPWKKTSRLPQPWPTWPSSCSISPASPPSRPSSRKAAAGDGPASRPPTPSAWPGSWPAASTMPSSGSKNSPAIQRTAKTPSHANPARTKPHNAQMDKIIYIHGLSSSGMSSTATNLRALLPECEVLSPDLPIAPDKAYDMLCRLCNEEQPRLLIGTSMGGMFAQQVRGYRKILVNPAFHVSAFMRTQLGIREFLNPRQDGATHYEITPDLCDAYQRMEENQFAGISDFDRENTYALFGTNDTLVHGFEEYTEHYQHATWFEGEHRLNPDVTKAVVVPLIKKILRQ